jgi:hypothetical protein
MPEGVFFIFIKVDYTVRAVDDAVSTTNALIRVMHGDITICLMHGSSRATCDAGGFFTVIAEGRNILIFDIRELASGTADTTCPGDAVLNIIFILTGDNTGTTPYAFL